MTRKCVIVVLLLIEQENNMKTYRVIYMNNFARNLITLEARDEEQLIKKLDNRCITKSQIKEIKEGY